jgi:hypothetical protein
MKTYFFFSSIFTAVLLSVTAPCYSFPDITAPIGVIELRNYVIKDGKRAAFIDYFEKNFITPQEALKHLEKILTINKAKMTEECPLTARPLPKVKDNALIIVPSATSSLRSITTSQYLCFIRLTLMI